jgi:membrane protein YqaA with SNARE-associated domain
MGIVWIIAAALWGVAEATVFFVVPDVILTYATVRHGWRVGARLAVVAAAAAAVAGIGMWFWGRLDSVSARHVMLMIPGIGPDLLVRTSREMGGFWPLNLFIGALTGVPYKLYAVAAGAHAVPVGWFAVASYVARFGRFAFSVGITWLGLDAVARLGLLRWRYYILTAGWVILYAVYYTLRAHAG